MLSIFNDRLPISEGWHLVALILGGCAVVALLHRIARRKAAAHHARLAPEDEEE